MTEKLTNKQEAFVLALIDGKSQREAYRSAYKAERMKDKTVDEKASRLFAEGKVRARFDELQAKVAGKRNGAASRPQRMCWRSCPISAWAKGIPGL